MPSAGSAATTAAPTEPTDGGQAASARLAQIAGDLQTVAETTAGSSFAGVSIDVTQNAVSVYLTAAPTTELRAAGASYSSSATISYKTVGYSLQQLTEAQQSLVSQASTLRDQGIVLVEVGPDVWNNTLHVGIVKPTPSQESAVAALVPVPITVEARASTVTPMTTRLNDVAPFNGGNFMSRVVPGGVGGCTTGVPVYNSSTGEQAMLIAGHCVDFTKYIAEYNDDYVDSNGCLVEACANLGNSQHIVSFGQHWDSALLSTKTYSRLDWENYQPYNPPGTLNGFTNPQQTYTTSIPGELVCPSGAYEGMVCGSQVLYVRQTIPNACYPQGCMDVYYMDRAQNTSQIPTGAGDSSAPVFTTPPNHLNIEGILVYGGDLIPCINYPARGVNCSHTFYYTDIAALWSHWTNWHLKTS